MVLFIDLLHLQQTTKFLHIYMQTFLSVRTTSFCHVSQSPSPLLSALLRSTAAPILRRVCRGRCVYVCMRVCGSVSGWTVAEPMKSLYHRIIKNKRRRFFETYSTLSLASIYAYHSPLHNL